MNKKYKVKMVEFSAVKDDGSRETLGAETICSCKNKGDAENIARLLMENTYSWIYKPMHNVKENHSYRISVEF